MRNPDGRFRRTGSFGSISVSAGWVPGESQGNRLQTIWADAGSITARNPEGLRDEPVAEGDRGMAFGRSPPRRRTRPAALGPSDTVSDRPEENRGSCPESVLPDASAMLRATPASAPDTCCGRSESASAPRRFTSKSLDGCSRAPFGTPPSPSPCPARPRKPMPVTAACRRSRGPGCAVGPPAATPAAPHPGRRPP